MSLAIKRLKVYLRVAIVVVLASAIALVLYKNRNHTVQFWFFGLVDPQRPINVIWLLWWTAGTTLLIAQLVRFMRGLLADLRAVRKIKAGQLAAAQHAKRLADLEARERKVAEQLAASRRQDEIIGETADTTAQGGAK
jgi:hypothetical protein